MNRDRFIKLMEEYGDAQVFIKGPVSKKIKYNIVTADLNNAHIKQRAGARNQVTLEGRVLTFAWDQDDFRQIDPADVIKVVPLNELVHKRYRSVHGQRS
jgi:hypothetical protein